MTCDCPIECNSISYSYSFVSRPFDPEKMCFSEKSSKDFLMKPLYKNKLPEKFVRRLKHFYKNGTSHKNEIDFCKRDIQYRAMVKFFLATESVSVTAMTRRLSFFDKLSAFGMTKHKLIIDNDNDKNFRWHPRPVYRN